MNVFISWSGEKARRVAAAMKILLQDANHRIIPWFSEADTPAGARWGVELANRLASTDFGIVCVTQESLQSPWVFFESGALSKSVNVGRVCPYLIDLPRPEFTGPLSQFQAREANREDTWQMLQTLNSAIGDDSLSEDRLRRYFDANWPAFEKVLDDIRREMGPSLRDVIKFPLDDPRKQPPPHWPLLRDLERARTSGELKNSEVVPLLFQCLLQEDHLEPIEQYDPRWLIVAIRVADNYFRLIRPSAGNRDWQRDFGKVATPVLVGVGRSLQQSSDAQATIVRLCDAVARRLRLTLVWPEEPDALNDMHNELYRECLKAQRIESDNVLTVLQGLPVIIGPD